MTYEDFFGLNNFRLICIIACFIIIFNNKLYPRYFKKKYKKVSLIWLIFLLILMLSSSLFFITFSGTIMLMPIFMHIMTFHSLKVDFGFRKRKGMSFSEFICFPHLFILYAVYSYLFIIFITNVVCRINAEIYLSYIGDPFSFFSYGYTIFFALFTAIFGFLNAIRIEKLFPDDNLNAI